MTEPVTRGPRLGASRPWLVLKLGVIGTSTFVVLGGIVAALTGTDSASTPSWLGAASGWLTFGFGFSAIVTWVAGLVDCARRTDMSLSKRAGVFSLLFIGNFVGSTLYFLLMPAPESPDD